MVAEPLVEPRISDGAQLVAALDEAKVPVRAAFWLYSSEWAQWRLVLASPLVDQGGPRRTYKRIQDVLRRSKTLQLRLDQITVLGVRDPLVRALSSVINTGSGISGIRFTNSTFNGLLFEDVYVYRLT